MLTRTSVGLLLFIAFVTVESGLTQARAQVAIGQDFLRKDAKGKIVKVKATGRHADCVSGGVKMGNTREAAVRYCDGRRAAGWVK
jgi:hypothetical protein